MKWKEEVLNIIEGVTLNKNNIQFKEIIENPWGCDHSTPKKLGDADETKVKETQWQRELYADEPNKWYDGELPIGQVAECGKVTRVCRVDLVGMMESRPVICELKYTKIAGQPFDALLQLLAYYCMIVKNAAELDKQCIHHTNVRNQNFKWVDIANNPILMLRANRDYWSNKDKVTPKNIVTRQILTVCKKHGLDIRFLDGDRPIEF